MTTIKFKNQFLPLSEITVYEFPDSYRSLTGAELKAFYSNMTTNVNTAPTYYYSTNRFVVELVPDEPGGPIDVSFSSGGGDIGSYVYAYWKVSNDITDPALLIDNYLEYTLEIELVSASEHRLEFKIKDTSISWIQDHIVAMGLTMPTFGIMKFTVPFSSGDRITYALKYCNEPVFAAFVEPATLAASDTNSYTTP